MTERPHVSGAVFLSYASQDAEAATRICEALRAAGVEVWLDKSQLRGGDAWDAQIKKHIHDCALFIPVISAHTNARSEGYFRREWKFATRRLLDMADDAAFLLPVVIDETRESVARVPEEFLHTQWTWLPSGETPPAFGQRVRQLLGMDSADLRHSQTAVTGAIDPSARSRTSARPWSSDAPERKVSLSRRSLIFIAIGVVVVVTGIFSGSILYHHLKTPAGSEQEQSIAVLPFENLSDEKANAFFADGIQDDILTSLAKVTHLKVISRSSVMQYRGTATRNLREIGRELGVANILEGSVRREGNRIVLNVQLIDAVHDRHLWANRYDRTLTDSLGLQGELAGEIASALRTTLTPEEKARIETKPTENAGAYVFYLRASQIERNPDTLLEDYMVAAQLYLQAIRLDPNFALAHARLASTAAQVFHYYEPVDRWKGQSRSEAERALRLQPGLAEAHLALGQYYYWIDGDYDRAVGEFEIAQRLSPSNADAARLIAAIKRRLGYWQEALDSYTHAQLTDPQNPNIVRELVFTHTAMRRWEGAAAWAQKMRAMAPASLVAKIQSGYVEFWWKGDTQSLKSMLSRVPAGTDPDGSITSSRWDVAMIDRDFAAARQALQASGVDEISYTPAVSIPRSFLQGLIELAQGNQTEARKQFELARPSFEKAVEEAPASADRHANLGWFYAFAGRKEDAIREGMRAVELKPEAKDAVDGAIMQSYLALIYARVGERDLAIRLLERLLRTAGAVDSVDYSITVNDLKSRWEWDPIRDDPRFQKLIAD
jgi:TolB-like protein/Flp pilus assembly protein TadD